MLYLFFLWWCTNI